MTEFTLALSEQLFDELRAALGETDERAGVLLCGAAPIGSRTLLTGYAIRWIPEEHYLRRAPDELAIRSEGWVPILREATDDAWVPLFFHTHPRARARPSARDAVVDDQLAGVFRVRARTQTYGSVILGGSTEHPSFTGRVQVTATGPFAAISRLRVAGRRIRLLLSDEAPGGAEPLDAFDRQIRAFGRDGQRLLKELRVGVVGAGGTGSAVAEMVGRLGIGELALIDDDAVDETNLTRIHGATRADVGRAKVDVAADAVRALGLGTTVRTHSTRISQLDGITALHDCDVVFGCTDDELGRVILNRLAYWYLIPVIDMGARLRSRDEMVTHIEGRVTYLAPGESCLICRDRIDLARARDEGLPEDERERLAAEGYAEGLDEPDPAIVAYTTMVAAWAIADLLERLLGFGDPGISNELVIRIHDRRMSSPAASPNPAHLCCDADQWAKGARDPLLDLTWA